MLQKKERNSTPYSVDSTRYNNVLKYSQRMSNGNDERTYGPFSWPTRATYVSGELCCSESDGMENRLTVYVAVVRIKGLVEPNLAYIREVNIYFGKNREKKGFTKDFTSASHESTCRMQSIEKKVEVIYELFLRPYCAKNKIP